MPKLPRAPRVSIVIPLQRDEKLFEETLLSVLENRLAGCQIVAVHNGTYTDPFDLSDEVSFVTARSSNLVDLVRDAFDATAAPLVHVLGAGMKATPGWLDEAFDRFDDADVAAVAPALADPVSGRTVGSGWSDIAGRLCHPNADHRGQGVAGQLSGFFLNAFFIRRRLFGNLLDAVAPAMNDSVAVSYAFGCLLKRGGWKIDVAGGSQIDASEMVSISDESDFARGQCLAAIRARVLSGQPLPSFGELLRTALFGSSSLGEMTGMLRHRTGMALIRRAIDPDSVPTIDQSARVLSLPSQPPRQDRAAA